MRENVSFAKIVVYVCLIVILIIAAIVYGVAEKEMFYSVDSKTLEYLEKFDGYKTLNEKTKFTAIQDGSIKPDFEIIEGEMITNSQYDVMAFTPLIFVVAQDLDPDILEELSVNYSAFMDVVISGGTWKDFHEKGDEEVIRVYYPMLDSKEGKLYESYLKLMLNNGAKEFSLESLNKIEAFLGSSNTYECDVAVKLSKAKRNIAYTDMYVITEHNLIFNVLGENNANYEEFMMGSKEKIVYPERTVVSSYAIIIHNEKIREELMGRLNKYIFKTYRRTNEYFTPESLSNIPSSINTFY